MRAQSLPTHRKEVLDFGRLKYCFTVKPIGLGACFVEGVTDRHKLFFKSIYVPKGLTTYRE
jgi:hypothetical protein